MLPSTIIKGFLRISTIIVIIILFQVSNKGNNAVASVLINIPPCDSCNGSIDLSVSGNENDFRFLWSDGNIAENRSQLCPGTYTVTITDQFGSSAERIFEVVSEKQFEINAEITHVSCFGGNDGVINLSIDNTGDEYTYQWSDGQSTEDIFALAPGTYMVTVNNHSCRQQLEFTINETTPLVVESDIVYSSTLHENEINLAIAGGAGDYLVMWSDGQVGKSIKAKMGNDYNVVVSDQHGCVYTDEFKFSELDLSLTIETSGSNCKTGLTNLNAQVSGGKAPYFYTWSNGILNADANNLAPGTYSVFVTDSEGRTTMAEIVTGTNYKPMNISFTSVAASCHNAGDGGIDLYVEGGIEPFTYQWNDGNIAEDLLLVQGGNYSVTVTDGMGCEIHGEMELDAPLPLEAKIITVNSGNSVNAFADVNGGSAPYTYAWSTGNILNEIVVQGVTNNLAVVVTDENGCTVEVNNEDQNLEVMNLRKKSTDGSK